MKIYDKVQWHLDAGENKETVVSRFKEMFKLLNQYNLLTDDGLEIYDLGIDADVSIHEYLINDKGNKFFEMYYDEMINLNTSEIQKQFEKFLECFDK